MTDKLARCIGDGSIVHFQASTGIWIDDGGHNHSNHELDFGPAEIAPIGNNPAGDISQPGKVVQRITDAGYYYRLREGGEEIGPFTVEDEEDPALDQTLASKFGVDVKEILVARLYEVKRPTNFDEVADVLGCTIRHDRSNKLILFAAGCLTFTDEDQFNLLMAGESAGGKSYTAQEVVSYFPADVIRWIGGASPSSFYHLHGTWDEENKAIRVDLRQKILVFLDSPHYSLLEKLRPLLSHDRKELAYQIVDKNKRGSLRTKNVILVGYPTVIFCSGKLSLDEQERTRVFLLSPETDQEKLQESILLRIKKDGNRDAFKKWIDTHPARRCLKARIDAIRNAKIDQVIVEDQEAVYERFLASHRHLAPRHQRDISRIMALIKAHAMLNLWQREKPYPGAIVANQEDLDAGFSLYQLIATANELGLAPELYHIWEQVIRPLVEKNESGVPNRTIMAEYHRMYGRFLADRKLRREILPALESCGLILLESDPSDRRQKLVTLALSDSACPPHDAHISDIGGVGGNVGEVRGHPQQDTAKQPPGPLDILTTQRGEGK